MSTKALFLDRDGVINVDYGYVHHKSNFEFLEGIFDLTRLALDKYYKIIIVTNQSGIGRGLYSEEIFLKLNAWMCECFKKEGVTIDRVYYCASHPSSGIGIYKKKDFRRKPEPGMFIEARKEFNINMEDSVLIGDKMTDIQAGARSGIGRLLFLNNKIKETHSNNLYTQISNLNNAMIYL